MKITDTRFKLTDDSDERLLAFCTITLDDCFVIRDLKIINGQNGQFVAMPSRKLTAHCPQCMCNNHLRANNCNQCGIELEQPEPERIHGRAKIYADVAHPINERCRKEFNERILSDYEAECQRAKAPGYHCTYDEPIW